VKQTEDLKSEIEKLKIQIDLLDKVFDDYSSKKDVSYCDSLKISIKEYYESILHKLGYSYRKEE
tara:strand:+ start:1692 stop:1883 length:192 start_codon:yes stop_codon:yes gene_type:complete